MYLIPVLFSSLSLSCFSFCSIDYCSMFWLFAFMSFFKSLTKSNATRLKKNKFPKVQQDSSFQPITIIFSLYLVAFSGSQSFITFFLLDFKTDMWFKFIWVITFGILFKLRSISLWWNVYKSISDHSAFNMHHSAIHWSKCMNVPFGKVFWL